MDTWWNSMTPRRRLALLVSMGIAAAAMAAASWILLRTEQAILFTDLRPQDAAAMTALLALSGGVSNAFTTMYFVPMTLAIQLSPGWAWAIGGACLLGFASLFVLGADLWMRGSNVASEGLQRFDERIVPVLLFLVARTLYTRAGDARRIIWILILVGVSRAGKTPTCVYLALHYGIRAANYPLTDDDLDSERLPKRLLPYRQKIFGLTIDPERLQQIRQERRPNSRYSQLETCRREVAQAEAMFGMERIPVLSTTHASIEEIASRVLEALGINRVMF